MGEVIHFNVSPIIRVERFGGLWGVSVRPCPEGSHSLRSFRNELEAAEYATALATEHGWRVRPERYDLTDISNAPGAA